MPQLSLRELLHLLVLTLQQRCLVLLAQCLDHFMVVRHLEFFT
jgi:hypothetical protein